MDEKIIKDRISTLVELATGGTVSIETCGQVVQGAASLIVHLYGPGSTQLTAFETALAAERKRIAQQWFEGQPASIAEMVAGRKTYATLASRLQLTIVKIRTDPSQQFYCRT